MRTKNSIIFLIISTFLLYSYQANTQHQDTKSEKVIIRMVLGSTRQGRIADKIADALLRLLHDRTDVRIELVDLRDYLQQGLANIISTAQALIFLASECNSTYPVALKHALEQLHAEGKGKPVGLIGYGDGRLGGAHALDDLARDVRALKMKPVKKTITIPHIWKIVDSATIEDILIDMHIKSSLTIMVDELIAALKQK